MTRSVAFLSRLLEAGVDVRFADLPQIEGATGKFMLTQMVSVAELEAGLIGSRTKAALAGSKKKLAGQRRVVTGVTDGGRKIYGDYVTISDRARAMGTEARQRKARERAADLAPVIADLRASGITSMTDIATALMERGIPTARGSLNWTPVQASRVLARLPSRSY